jgi:hypothetical protein
MANAIGAGHADEASSTSAIGRKKTTTPEIVTMHTSLKMTPAVSSVFA